SRVETRLASWTSCASVKLSDAIWKTCSPRTLAMVFTCGTAAISLSTGTLAAVYVALLAASAPAPAIVPPVARMTTFGFLTAAAVLESVISRAPDGVAPIVPANNRARVAPRREQAAPLRQEIIGDP